MVDILTLILLTLPLAVAGGWFVGYRRGRDRARRGGPIAPADAGGTRSGGADGGAGPVEPGKAGTARED